MRPDIWIAVDISNATIRLYNLQQNVLLTFRRCRRAVASQARTRLTASEASSAAERLIRAKACARDITIMVEDHVRPSRAKRRVVQRRAAADAFVRRSDAALPTCNTFTQSATNGGRRGRRSTPHAQLHLPQLVNLRPPWRLCRHAGGWAAENNYCNWRALMTGIGYSLADDISDATIRSIYPQQNVLLTFGVADAP